MNNALEEKQEVFSGPFEECLKHFAADFSAKMPKFAQKTVDAKIFIADFCGRNIYTISEWLAAKYQPAGTSLMKMMCYLDMVGYRIFELERMSKAKRHFIELIGFGILSAQEGSQLLSYSQPGQLLKILREDVGTTESKEQRMWEIWRERKEVLEQKKMQRRQALPGVPEKNLFQKEPFVKANGMIDSIDAMVTMENLLRTLDEDFSQEVFENLLRGKGTVLRLSAKLNELSYTILKAEEKKGGDS